MTTFVGRTSFFVLGRSFQSSRRARGGFGSEVGGWGGWVERGREGGGSFHSRERGNRAFGGKNMVCASEEVAGTKTAAPSLAREQVPQQDG